MSFSRLRTARARAVVALGVAAGLLTAVGCAHAPGGRPAPEEEPRATAEPASPATPADTPKPEAAAPPPEPGRTAPQAAPAPPNAPDQKAPGLAAPARLDPTEEITPQELATIPDPVPGQGPGEAAPVPPREAPSDSTEPGKGGNAPAGGETRSPAPSEAVWSVQIFASEDLKEAESVARRAAAALRSEAFVTPEPPLHKVRVGRFATEEEAQALRDRAVRAGYAGAFRIRTAARW